MTSADIFAQERRLRRLASKRGFVLVKPWSHNSRGVGGGGIVLVPQNSGMTLDEAEKMLTRHKTEQH